MNSSTQQVVSRFYRTSRSPQDTTQCYRIHLGFPERLPFAQMHTNVSLQQDDKISQTSLHTHIVDVRRRSSEAMDARNS